MTSIKEILYPTDFSDLSTAGYQYCLQLALKLGANVHLVHAYKTNLNIPTTASFGLKMSNDREKITLDSLHNFEKSNHIDGVNVICATIHNSPREGIVLYAEEHNIDLIVMPTQGENNTMEILFGSTTVSILTNATCPVWVIPEGASFEKDIRQLAYATDLSQENIDNILLPLEIAKAYEAHFNYIYVTSEEGEILEEEIEDILITEYEGVNIDAYIIENNRIEDGIFDFIQEIDVDLLVTYSSQKSLLEQLLHLSVTRDIIQKAKTPLLVMK